MKAMMKRAVFLCGLVLMMPHSFQFAFSQTLAPGASSRTVQMSHLGLTTDQAARIRAIDADTAKALIALRSAGLSSSDMHARILQIRATQRKRTAAVLTSDQLSKYQAMVARATPQPGGRAAQKTASAPR